MQQAGTAKLIDIRDIRELQREGRIDGALQAPRGMLEFWAEQQKLRWFCFAPSAGAPLLLQKPSKIWEWIIFGI